MNYVNFLKQVNIMFFPVDHYCHAYLHPFVASRIKIANTSIKRSVLLGDSEVSIEKFNFEDSVFPLLDDSVLKGYRGRLVNAVLETRYQHTWVFCPYLVAVSLNNSDLSSERPISTAIHQQTKDDKRFFIQNGGRLGIDPVLYLSMFS